MASSFSSLFFSLPGRYAQALLNTSDESFIKDFDVTLSSLNHDPASEILLNSTFLNKKHVIAFIDILSSKLGLMTEFSNFLKLLVVKNRLNILNDIFRCYVTLWNTRHNIRPIVVTSAIELDKNQTKKIKNILSSYFTEELVITFDVDKAVLGGILVKADNLRMDATVLYQIQSLGSFLKAD